MPKRRRATESVGVEPKFSPIVARECVESVDVKRRVGQIRKRQGADALLEDLDWARLGFPQMGFQFGEGPLDRVQVGGVVSPCCRPATEVATFQCPRGFQWPRALGR